MFLVTNIAIEVILRMFFLAFGKLEINLLIENLSEKLIFWTIPCQQPRKYKRLNKKDLQQQFYT